MLPQVDILFGFRRAVGLAISMVLLAGWGAAVAAYPAVETRWDMVAIQLWWICLLVLNMCVLGPQTRWTGIQHPRLLKTLTACGSLGLLLFPFFSVCRRGSGKIAGAAQGGAALMTVTRACQLLSHIEHARASGKELDWSVGRRMYFMSAWGWHDLERTTVVPAGMQAKELRALMLSLVSWVRRCSTNRKLVAS